MTTTTFINTLRHARTQFNAERRYAGTIDISLNQAGIRDSRLAAEKLAENKFDVVVTSGLKRAIMTAKFIAKDRIPIVQTELCNERNFGVLEGLTWDDIQTLRPPILLISVGNDLHTVNPKGGEPFEDVWERAKKFRRFIFREFRGKDILVVSHGVFLQMFHGVLKGSNCIESLGVYPSNLELARFKFAGERLIEMKLAKLAGAEALHW